MKSKFLLIPFLVLILDHVSKWLVRTRTDPHQVIDIIPGYLRLSYVHNSGVAFGLFADLDMAWKPYILSGMAIIAVVVILLYSSRMPPERTLLQVSLAMTMGGILGNLADRIVRGFVVDFIEFHIYESFHWPTFNIADSAITIGIGLLLIDTIRNPGIEEISGQSATGSQQ